MEVFDRRRVSLCLRYILPVWLLVDALLRPVMPNDLVRLIACLFYHLDDRIVDILDAGDQVMYMHINLNEPMLWIALDVVAVSNHEMSVERLHMTILSKGVDVGPYTLEVKSMVFKYALTYQFTGDDTALFDHDMAGLDEQEKMCSMCVRDFVTDVSSISIVDDEESEDVIAQ